MGARDSCRFSLHGALLLLFFACARSVPTSVYHGHPVELIQPLEEWTTYGGETGGRTLRTVSRAVSRSPLSDDPIAYTVRSGSHCADCGHKHKSEFEIDVVKPPDAAVQRAVEKAAYIMEHSWKSKVPVVTRITFGNLGAPDILANGGGTFFCRIRSMFDEILPIAAGEAILGRDLNKHKDKKGKYDVLITINTNAPWYFGTDGKPPAHSYDLVTVLLHEFYHNLLFTGGIYVTVRKTKDRIVQKAHVHEGRITRFDAFLATENGCSVLIYLKDKELKKSTGLSGDELLAAALTNDRLYFGWESHGKLVKLHAPKVFVPKSSIYHLDPDGAGGDLVMTPKFLQGRAQHAIGPRIIKMQHLYLDPDVKGANDKCPRPLPNPQGPAATHDDYERSGSNGSDKHPPFVVVNPKPIEVPHYGRFPVGWIIALSILGVILLLTLCALLFCILWKLKKKIKGSSTSGTSISSSDIHRPGHPGVPGHPGEPPEPELYGPSQPGPYGQPGPPGGAGGSYKTPTHTSYSGGYPSAVPGLPPPSKTKSSYRPPSHRPPSHRPPSHKPPSSCKPKPPSCKPKPSTKPSSSRRPPPSTRPPSSRPKSRPPKTEDYFDCS